MGTGAFIESLGRWELIVSLPDTAPQTRAEAVQVLDAFANLLREMTGGRMQLGTVWFAPHPRGLSAADIVFVQSGDADSQPGGLGRPGLFIQLALHDAAAADSSETCGSSTPMSWPLSVVAKLMHEFGHYAFDLGDEYTEDGPGGTEVARCACIMADLSVHQFCGRAHNRTAATKQNSMHHRASCHAVMASRYPVLRTRAVAGEAPVVPVSYLDVEPSSATALVYCKDAAPGVVRAIDAIVALWTAVGKATDGVLMAPVPQFSDPMQAVVGGLALFDAKRRHWSQAIVLVGFPSSTDAMAPLAQRVARGKSVPVSAVSPCDPSAPLRDFAHATGGVCEVVVQTGILAEVDLRARLLCRLGQCVDGFGIGLLHRVVLSAGVPLHQVLCVEPDVHALVLAVCMPGAARAQVEVADPSGNLVAHQVTSDGSMTWILVSQPAAGAWTVKVCASAPVPIALVGLIHNDCVHAMSAQPQSAYKPGQQFELTATLVVPTEQPSVSAPRSVWALPSAANARRRAPTSEPWGDGVAQVVTHFTTGRLPVTANWRGYADARIDFRLDPVEEPGVEPVVRVLPFQLRVVESAAGRVAAHEAT